MPHITVTADQAKLILGSTEHIDVRDEQGHHLGIVSPVFTEKDIEIARQRAESDEPRYTTDEVLAHLRALGPEGLGTR